jgi:hypothetical protein
MPKLLEKLSALKREHPVLKNMKILDFSMRIRKRIRIRNPARQY